MDPLSPGASPGTLVHRGERYMQEPVLGGHHYSATELRPITPDWAKLPEAGEGRLWLEVTGVHDIERMDHLGATYDIPSLLLEDIMHTGQRPKFEERAGGGLLMLRMLRWGEGGIEDEQVGVWWNEDTLISFQERPGDCFEPVRARLESKVGRIRQHGSPYLAYALADAIVDHVFVVLDQMSDLLADTEERILSHWRSVPLSEIQAIRGRLNTLRRGVAPLRDVTSALLRSETGFADELRPYLRDLHDHVIQALDAAEQQRETVAGLRDLWMNAQSTHMNRVMQVLTVIATIFIPLTFLAGIYGMNFSYMPELQYQFAYPVFLGVMALIALLLLWMFQRAGWLSAKD